MKELRNIVSNIINYFLKIRKDDIVAIDSEIYNGKGSVDPLTEIPMVEALMMELNIKKAYPLLNISIESIEERIKNELSDFPSPIPEKINRNFIETIDTFIEVGWKKLSRDINNSQTKLKIKKDPQIFYWHKIFENKKNLVFFNYPSPQLANHLKIEMDKLLKIYKKSIDCNYERLKIQAEDLKDEFFSYAEYRIISQKEKFNIKIIKDKYQFFMGTPLDHQVTILPAGVIEFPMDKVSLDGVFIAEKVYYKDLIFNNVKLNFSDGVIRYISFKAEEKGNYSLQNTIMNSQKECYFSLGFNPEISDYTGFYLYDRCINGNISLKFFDQESFPIVFSNLNAEINKRKRMFMGGNNNKRNSDG